MRGTAPIALLRRNRDLRALFLAQVISFAGDWFAFVALVGLVLDLTGSDLAGSQVFVATILPTFLASSLVGPAVDRFDRRRLMVGVSIAQAALALLLLAVGPGRAWLASSFRSTTAAQQLVAADNHSIGRQGATSKPRGPPGWGARSVTRRGSTASALIHRSTCGSGR